LTQAPPYKPVDFAWVDLLFWRTNSKIDRSIERLLDLLKSSPQGAVFNPWWQVDAANDIGPQAPAIRREQLRAYLSERMGKAQLALVGEALGYRGGHFTGIAMTSERILLGGNSEVAPEDVFSAIKPQRTSRLERAPRGFSEPTASVVWSTLLGHGMRGNEFVLWNVFPWHSFAPRLSMLKNRMPTHAELAASEPVLKAFSESLPRRTTRGRGAPRCLPTSIGSLRAAPGERRVCALSSTDRIASRCLNAHSEAEPATSERGSTETRR
jgi:hypothetical protein